MIRLTSIRLLAIAALVAVPAQDASAQVPAEGYRVGERAPAIMVNDLDGNPVDLGQWVGQVPVYLQFWATWCERCEALMPTVREAAERFRGAVRFIGINVAVNQSPDRVRRYVEEVDPPFMVLYDDLGASVRAFNVQTTSWVVIIDGGGIVRYVGVGGEQHFMDVLEQVTSVDPVGAVENP